MYTPIIIPSLIQDWKKLASKAIYEYRSFQVSLAPTNMYIFFLEHTGYSRGTDRGQPSGASPSIHSLINKLLFRG